MGHFSLPRELFNWCMELSALSEAHVLPGTNLRSAAIPLLPSVLLAVQSGHMFYYVLYNALCDLGWDVELNLEGVLGEPTSGSQKETNWTMLLETCEAAGMDIQPKLSARLKFGEELAVVDLLWLTRQFYRSQQQQGGLKILGGETSPSAREPSPTRARSKSKSSSSSPSRNTPSPVRQHSHQSSVSPVRVREPSSSPPSSSAPSPTVQPSRASSKRRGASPVRAPPPAVMQPPPAGVACKKSFSNNAIDLPQYQNRNVALSCLSIVDEIVGSIFSGEAQRRIEQQEERRNRVRRSLQQRREEGHRLVDRAAVSGVGVAKHVDHNVAVFIHRIVLDIVKKATADNIIDELIARDEERRRNRGIVQALLARERQKQFAEEEHLPLKLRKLREKEEAERGAKEAEEERRTKHQRMRVLNRERAIETRRAADEAKARQVEEEGKAAQKELKKKQQRETYLVEARHLRQRRAIESEENGIRDTVVGEQDKEKEVLASQYRYHRHLVEKAVKRKLEASQEEPKELPKLSSISLASKEPAAYIGETFGRQFLTAYESELFDVISTVRQDPSVLEKLLADLMAKMTASKCMWFTDASKSVKEPLLMREGRPALEDAISSLSRARPCKPSIGTPSIALTLAARQHAADLAHHGILQSRVHVGSDGSSLAQRAARYGTCIGAGGCQELVYGVVRPRNIGFSVADIVGFWAVDDGEPDRLSRKLLLMSGETVKYCGVGHSRIVAGEKMIDVVCYIMAPKFEDKPVHQMAGAHEAALLSLTCPEFIQSGPSLSDSILPKALHAAPNVYVGRSAPLPDVKRLTRTESHTRRTVVPPSETHGLSVCVRPDRSRRLAPLSKEGEQQQETKGKQKPATETAGSADHEEFRVGETQSRKQPSRRLLPVKHKKEKTNGVVDGGETSTKAEEQSESQKVEATRFTPTTEEDFASVKIQSFFRMVHVLKKDLVRKEKKRELSMQATRDTELANHEREYARLRVQTVCRMFIAKIRAHNIRRDNTLNPIISLLKEKAVNRIGFLVFRDRIQSIYQQHLPDKLDSAGTMLERYDEREDVLLQALIEKYGPEENLVEQLMSYFNKVDPTVADRETVVEMLKKNAAHEEEWMASLFEQYGVDPNPSDPNPK